MPDSTVAPSSSREDGFGLVEIVVSMLLLALLSMALLPLLIQGIRRAASTATLATATQLVNDQIDSASRLAAPVGCSTIAALASSNVPSPAGGALTDSRGVPLRMSVAPEACPSTPASYPTTVKLTVTVIRTDTGATLAQAVTRIYVDSAGS